MLALRRGLGFSPDLANCGTEDRCFIGFSAIGYAVNRAQAQAAGFSPQWDWASNSLMNIMTGVCTGAGFLTGTGYLPGLSRDAAAANSGCHPYPSEIPTGAQLSMHVSFGHYPGNVAPSGPGPTVYLTATRNGALVWDRKPVGSLQGGALDFLSPPVSPAGEWEFWVDIDGIGRGPTHVIATASDHPAIQGYTPITDPNPPMTYDANGNPIVVGVTPGGSSGSGGGAGGSGGSGGAGSGNGGSGGASSFFSSIPSSIGGIPLWGIGAGVLGLVLVMSLGGRR